ncbi:hypothetical protein PAXINDRAFT_102055 [Paxillus involutus ATCC 200175]|uniref:Protein kinase domain-containing protein n=1 Tax=Paxillus involutus ATCC 200175 TaxID=664439 RepID=A0A0C9SRB4_PAXIN|nr:hypothetical protein PAXINDRAFT_102055 [Paxillus involutus ATCC 200175]
MDGTSTDATYAVDPAVGASTALSGAPERARHTLTGTATPTLRSDIPPSSALPSINGDSSTPYRVRPNLTINPHALPIEHRRRADEGHILTPHAHFYDSPGDEIVEVPRERGHECALPPSPSPASNISPVNTNSRQSTTSRPSLSGPHWTDAFRGRRPPKAPVSSSDGRLRDGSTSSKVSTARKSRSATNPHWTDALCQPDFVLPSKVPGSVPPPSFDRVYVLPETSPVSPLTVTFPECDDESISGVPTPAQDLPAPSSSSLSDVRTRISLVTLPKPSTVPFQQPSETSLAGPSRNDETAVDRLQESPPNLPRGAADRDQGGSLPPQQDFNTTQPAQQEVMSSAEGHSSQSSLQPHQDFNTTQSVQQTVVSSEEGHSSQPSSALPTTIDKGKGEGPRPLAPVERDSNMRSGTAWRLIDIRSNFPPDLTGRVVRESQDPFSCGGFGDIYRSTLRMSGRSIDVAVKAIRTYTDDDGDDAKKEQVSIVEFLPLSLLVQQAVQRFRREIKTWLNLDHNNVVPLFGTTMNFGRFPAMVCPWLENGSLTSYLERPDSSLTTVERLSLVSGVAAGLQYLHSQSVVHGDLSGSNVLVDGKGRACISDFGLSTLLTQLGGSTFATSHQPPGTLRWTAPELLEFDEPEDEDNPPQIIPSPRSDVYSFGRIMLQILTGKVPYHYCTREAQVMNAISKGAIPKRPRQELVTDRQWLFMQRCWNPVDASEPRPCDEEIVEFAKQELLEIKAAS